jgi:hypothetical protein
VSEGVGGGRLVALEVAGGDGLSLAGAGGVWGGLAESGFASDGVGGAATVRLAVASLRAADSPRLGGENLGHAEALAQAGARLPPILVHRQTMRVIDGMHRWRAAQLRGEQTVEVQFFDGDTYQAFIAAVLANVTHGLPLTLADREAAAERILGWHAQWSDRSIGAVTGLAAGTVGSIRRRLGGAEAPDAARIGRDGRVRPVDPAEGRLKARDEILRRPEASLRELARAAGVSPATVKDVRDRLRRGVDPLPGGRRQRRGAGRASPAGGGPGGTEAVHVDLAASFLRLGRDPSVRYTESGRIVLRCLQQQVAFLERVEALVAVLPPHCGYLVAGVARQCARQWQAVAMTLETRLDTPSSAREPG